MAEAVEYYGYKFEGEESRSFSPLKEMLEVFELLKPRPSSYPLARVGDDRDGSYLIPEDLEGIAACFSPGVNNIKHFEDRLVDEYGIVCHMCDYSSDVSKFKTPIRDTKQTFLKKWLNSETRKFHKLERLDGREVSERRSSPANGH